jgi:adenylate kinase
MIVVLAGPPGAGKGTHGRRIAAKRGWPHVSSGDLLRDAVESGTDLGRRASEYMKAGTLVPDDIMLEWVEQILGRPEYANGIVLDGFPRTVPQAEGLDELLKARDLEVGRVLAFDIDEDAAVRRLATRISCAKCGFVYNLASNPPGDAETCRACGGKLETREDDETETVRARFEEYRSLTLPMIEYYRAKRKVTVISTDGTIDDVGTRVTEALDKLGGASVAGSADE